jgi:hypothetical protein
VPAKLQKRRTAAPSDDVAVRLHQIPDLGPARISGAVDLEKQRRWRGDISSNANVRQLFALVLQNRPRAGQAPRSRRRLSAFIHATFDTLAAGSSLGIGTLVASADSIILSKASASTIETTAFRRRVKNPMYSRRNGRGSVAYEANI